MNAVYFIRIYNRLLSEESTKQSSILQILRVWHK